MRGDIYDKEAWEEELSQVEEAVVIKHSGENRLIRFQKQENAQYGCCRRAKLMCD